MRRVWSPVAMMTLILALFGLRWLFPERPVDYVGFRALLDAGFALGLLGLVLLIAGGLGWKVLHWLGLEGLTSLDRIVFAIPIGMGILAYYVMTYFAGHLLNGMGVTHLLYNASDARFFMGRDPEGHHRRARTFLVQEFVPVCAKEVYRDTTVILWEISCQ